MIDTVNMGIMANMIQPTSISTQMISKKDSDEDSSLSFEEMGVSNDIFSSYDSDSSGLISQSELSSAVDSALSDFSGQMPSKEDFQTMLSNFGFDAGSTLDSSSSTEDTVSSILEDYDSNNLTQSDAEDIVAAFKEAGIEPSSELVSAMEEAGFDAQEIGTLAGVGGQGGMPPPPPSGGGESASSEEYDALDTNEDGVVSLDELQAGYESSTDVSELSANQQNALDNISVLMDMLKSGDQSEESSVDTKDFDGIMKAINNQNNNSQINLYLQNTTSSSLSGYA